MRGSMRLGRMLFACAVAASAVSAVPAAAQGSYSQYDESATAALGRYVRNLASDPKDFASLIGAGRAALALGDAEAAAGFFARADDVNPDSPLPQAGMGAVSVINGDAQGSFAYFTRAQQFGATMATIGCDRGLAYDLLGQQTQAQADYRAALSGPDRDEARRRLALSLAIGGDRSGALQTLSPLMAKRDPGAARARAFVLALTGDSAAALVAINAAMPGSSDQVTPFLQRLPALSAAQKAAAVNLGIFADSGTAPGYPARPRAAVATASSTTDRLASIDALLRSSPQASAPAASRPEWQPSRAVQVAYAPPPKPAVVQRTAAAFQPKIWLQLASGSDPDDLSARFRRIKDQDRDLFNGIEPYVATSGEQSLLLIGPFRGASDAEFFSQDLETLGVHPSKYVSSQTDRIAPLAAE